MWYVMTTETGHIIEVDADTKAEALRKAKAVYDIVSVLLGDREPRRRKRTRAMVQGELFAEAEG